MNERLDIYEDLPKGMRRYLSTNGWHFSKALCDHAVGKMVGRNGDKYNPVTKQEVDAQFKSANVTLKNDVLYDATYVFNMAMSDYYGGSLKSMENVCMFVKDYLDDKDGTPTRAMDEYVGRCIGAGCPIPWEDAL